MLLETLFEVPSQESCIIDCLIYVFSHCLFHRHFLVRTLSLKPSTHKKRVVLFPYVDKQEGEEENTMLYTSLPKDWDVSIVMESVSSQCPFYEQHLLIDFIQRLIHNCVFRVSTSVTMYQLHHLLSQLLQEIMFECTFCQQYQQLLETLPKESYLSLFIDSILNTSFQEEDIQKIITIHIANISLIKQQLRSEKIIQMILIRFYSLINESFLQFQQQPSQLHEIKYQLYRKLQDYLLQNIPFFNIKDIPFLDWIEQLFLLKCHIQEIPSNNQTVMLCLKKMIFLLHLFFPETKETHLEPMFYCNQTPIHENEHTSSLQNMYEYHPILRGSFFNDYFLNHRRLEMKKKKGMVCIVNQ